MELSKATKKLAEELELSKADYITKQYKKSYIYYTPKNLQVDLSSLVSLPKIETTHKNRSQAILIEEM